MADHDRQSKVLVIELGTRLQEAGIDINGSGATPGTRIVAVDVMLGMLISHTSDRLDMGGQHADDVAFGVIGAYSDFTSRPTGGLLDLMDRRLQEPPLREHPTVQLAGNLAMEGIEYADLPGVAGEVLVALAVADHRGILPNVI